MATLRNDSELRGFFESTPRPRNDGLVTEHATQKFFYITARGPVWAYAAAWKRSTEKFPLCSIRVEVSLQVSGGAIGLGCVNEKATAFIGSEKVLQPKDAVQTVSILIDDPSHIGHLVLRNADSSVAKAVVQWVRVFPVLLDNAPEAAGNGSVLLVLPDKEFPVYTIERMKTLLRRYFPEPTNQLTVAVQGDVSRLSSMLDGAKPFRAGMVMTANTVVIEESLLDVVDVPSEKRVYVLDLYHWHVLLHLHNKTIDKSDWPAIDDHVFNKNGPRSGQESQEYFPFGFICRYGMAGGPVDAFGFRIGDDLEALRNRPASHKVVAVLGGSAALSTYAFYEETFAKRLEERLRAYVSPRNADETVTVLNFGQGDGVLLHEMIVWMLHVEKLHPEIVISHDGFNDLCWGMTTDPYLIRQGICAPHIYELWAQKLHDRDEIRPRFAHGDPARVVNGPRQVVSAYLERKGQLDNWVRRAGAYHVAGLQPISESKALSPLENEFKKHQRYIWIWGDVFARMKQTFDQIGTSAEAMQLPLFDLHRYFQRFGPEETLFQDFMHTTPAGDDRVAEAYFDYIVQNGAI